MSDEGDEDFRTQSKYKQFSSAVDKALKVFELSTEWHDLISSLAKLNKVLLAYMQYPVVPHQLTVCKRLTQCLHPNLPSGVHIKTLDVYKAIFDRIGPSGLSADLLAYSSGLFPLITYSSMAVRSQVIDIYEQYYIPLGENLRPALHGMVLGLLPGLEDESEHTDRINRLLDTVCEITDLSFFSSALWQCVLSSPEVRVPAANLILSKLDRKLTAEDQVHVLGGNLPLMVSAICAGLTDKNVLAVRSLLDILSLLFPLHRPFLLPTDITAIVVAALEALLKRDISLNRRLFAWLLGSNFDKATLSQHLPKHAQETKHSEMSYFQVFSMSYVQSALKQLCAQAVLAAKRSSASKLDCVHPYRLLRALLERAEISDALLEGVLMDAVSCLKEQVESLGGVGPRQDGVIKKTPSEDLPKKLGRKAALKLEILQSVNLLFNALNPGFLWKWLSVLLEASFTSSSGASEEPSMTQEEANSDIAETESVDITDEYPLPKSRSDLGSPVSPTFVQEGETSFGVRQSVPGDKMSCSHVISLTMFLLKSLPLDSIENAHLLHLPHLTLILLNCLHKSHSSLTQDELQITFDLISCIIHELMSSPSSRASTPSTPLSTTGRKSIGKSPASTPIESHSVLSESGHFTMEQLVRDITDMYLQFYSSFVRESVIETQEKVPIFSAASQLLVLVAKFARGVLISVEDSQGPTSTDWIDNITKCCTLDWDSQDHHPLNFVSLETLLKLLQLQELTVSSEGFPGVQTESSTVATAFITEPLQRSVSVNHAFLRNVIECLWSCVSSSHPSYHYEAAILLSWLHKQLSMPSVCETIILEHFMCDGLEAYHSFAVLWEHSPHAQGAKLLHRCILRMLEGLKSDSPSVRHFVQSWVTFALSREDDLHFLMQPLIKILAAPTLLRRPALDRESEKYRVGMSLSAKDAEKDQAYAKYYYDSLGIPDPLDFSKTGQHCEILCHYSQVVDTRQVLYSLSLLQSTIEVDPATVIGRMGKVLVETGSYTQWAKERHGTGEESDSSGKKSLLELVISLCVDLMRTEYPSTLEASLSNHLDNLSVRMSSVELLCSLVEHLAKLSADNQNLEGDARCPILSSGFVSALITLCDVQKATLLMFGRLIKELRDFKASTSHKENIWLSLQEKGSNVKFTLQAFLTQLLLLVYALVALETQCHSKQTVSVTTPQTDRPQSSGLKSCKNEWLPPILPSLPSASQPFFQALLLDIISDPNLSHLHKTVLHLTTALLPNLLDHQLTELGSKLLKQICTNLEASSTKARHPGKDDLNYKLTALYLSSMYSIISWCLFGEAKPSAEEQRSGYKTINSYWKKIRVADIEDQSDTLSPTSRQPSTMSWLFSVFSTSVQMNGKTLSSTEGGSSRHSAFSRSRVGINSRAGQHMLMLLPAVYNAITEVWRSWGHCLKEIEWRVDGLSLRGNIVKRKSIRESQEVVHLVSQLVSNLAHREPSAFFSSVSHVWMEWNLGAGSSQRKSKRKGLLIELLHHIQALPLGGVIDCVQTTLSEVSLADDKQSGLLRQKYLLHFLYKYISSTLQSSEELADCSGQLVTFLREFYNESTATSDPLTTHILCMLTSILHVVVCRVPSPEPKKQKKERKELQELIHKLCEALSVAANTGTSHPDYSMLKRHTTPLENHVTSKDNLVTSQGNHMTEEENVRDPSSNPKAPSPRSGTYSPTHILERERPPHVTVSHSDSEVVARRDNKGQRSKVTREVTADDASLPTIQALAVLSNVLSHFVDCAFEGSEKDKVIALLKAVMGNVWPHLQSHSPQTEQSYLHAVKLLSSLSSFQVSRKAWRKEALDLYLSPSFFQVGQSSLREWRVVVDNLMTQDHVTFRDLLSRVHPSNTAGVVNIFTSVDQEVAAGARLLKRVAFALFSAEMDQFVEFLPDTQEKLSEYLKVLRHPPICSVVMLVFRVLLVRFSPSHLMSFWPAITSEMVSLLTDLDSDLCAEVSEGKTLSSDKLQLYLSVCKLLDTAMALPTSDLPHFQLLRWGFSNHDAQSGSEEYVVTKLCKQFRSLGSPTLEALHSHYTPHPTPPYLQSSTIASLRELKPLFTALSQPLSDRGTRRSADIAVGSQFSQTDEQQRTLKRIETILLHDFTESH